MEENKYEAALLLEEELGPQITIEEGEKLKEIQKHFIESYLTNQDKMEVEAWLNMEISSMLPEQTPEETAQISSEIITSLKTNEEKKTALEEAMGGGRSKESWLAGEMKKATSCMETRRTAAYLGALDEALGSANESLYRTINTEAGIINRNHNLDGFIAEQYHAQTFNLNAEATGSPYRAKVLGPTGSGYRKNSVDIVIVDESEKIVRRYQAKYCKNAAATVEAYRKGNYRGQQKLVPAEQIADIPKKAVNAIQAPDGTCSNKLTKDMAKQLQKEAQSGSWSDLNWNDYRTKDLAIGVSRQAGQAVLMGAAVGVGFTVVRKVWDDEEINGEEMVEAALSSGTDFGIKAAAAGALKVGVEKEVISVIPKGTPAGTLANIAFIAVENVKVAGQIASGKLSPRAGLDKMSQVSVAAVAGIAAGTEGMAIGAAAGTVFGPVGTAIGGFIGGTIGYMAGSKVGQKVAEGCLKIRDKAFDMVKSACRAVSLGTDTVLNGIKNLFVV